MGKKCRKCGGDGPFGKKKSAKDGLQTLCRECHRKWYTEYHSRNKEHIAKKRLEWLSNNSEQFRQSAREKYANYRMTPNGRAVNLVVAARRRCDDTTIDYSYVASIIKHGYCQVTGLEFDLTTKHGPFTPSLDRRDPKLGYTIHNTQVVVLCYNQAKGNWTHDDVVKMCQAISRPTLHVDISPGELIDKISILEIKMQRITDQSKLNNIAVELRSLRSVFLNSINRIDQTIYDQCVVLADKLKSINTIIWDIEDTVRECERNKLFNEKFITAARGVYLNNDERARLKREINVLLESQIVEEKSYAKY